MTKGSRSHSAKLAESILPRNHRGSLTRYDIATKLQDQKIAMELASQLATEICQIIVPNVHKKLHHVL